jgi:hypothetical protein
MSLDHHVRLAADATLGIGGVTSPIWLEFLDTASRHVALWGGALLVLGRIALWLWEVRDRLRRGISR